MFQFRRFPSIRYGLAYGYMRSSHVGFPIRISPDQWIFAPPRSFSQLVTSFIGSQCQGIHPAPFMLDLLNELFTHLWPPFRHSVGFRVLPHELLRTPYRLWDAAARFLPSVLTDVPPLVFSGLYVTSVTPRMSFLSLCVLRLDIDCCICGFQGTSPDGIIRRDGSLLPGPSGFFPADSVPARERKSSCS